MRAFDVALNKCVVVDVIGSLQSEVVDKELERDLTNGDDKSQAS